MSGATPFRCQLKLTPECAVNAEVHMSSGPIVVSACTACGKEYQRRFPHRISDLTIRPIEAAQGAAA